MLELNHWQYRLYALMTHLLRIVQREVDQFTINDNNRLEYEAFVRSLRETRRTLEQFADVCQKGEH